MNRPLKNKYFLISFSALIFLSIFIANKSHSLFTKSDIYALAASIQDDSFYYIIPAFNSSNGNGFTFGGEKSYGFQVGYELLLTTIAPFTKSLSELLRASLLLNAILFTSTGIAIYFCVTQAKTLTTKNELAENGAYAAGLISAIIYLSNYWNYFNSTTAKENAFAALLLATAIYLSLRYKKTPTRENTLTAGAICSLLLITRPVPSTILYLAIFCWVYRNQILHFIIAATPLIVGWTIFAKIYFDTIIPFPAKIKALAPSAPIKLDTLTKAFEYTATSIQFGIYGPSKVILPQPNWADALRPSTLESLLYVGFFVTFFLLTFSAIRKKATRKNEEPTILISLFTACIVGSFLMGTSLTLKRPAETYYASWYFYDSPVVIALLFGVGTTSLIRVVTNIHPQCTRYILPIVIATTIFTEIKIAEHYNLIRPYTTEDFQQGVKEERWQNVMIASGLWLRNQDPHWQNKKIAAYSAGALGFVLEDRVINLDGLANNNAATTILNKRPITDFLSITRPDYLIDIGNVNPTSTTIKLERVHLLPFVSNGGYQISRFRYQQTAP